MTEIKPTPLQHNYSVCVCVTETPLHHCISIHCLDVLAVSGQIPIVSPMFYYTEKIKCKFTGFFVYVCVCACISQIHTLCVCYQTDGLHFSLSHDAATSWNISKTFACKASWERTGSSPSRISGRESDESGEHTHWNTHAWWQRARPKSRRRNNGSWLVNNVRLDEICYQFVR